MTDAPERIWVDFEPRDWPSERIMYGDMPDPYVEYVRADLLPQWQPIETAPKDGTAFLALWQHWSHVPVVIFARNYAWHTIHSDIPIGDGVNGHPFDDPHGPTHWTHWPAPPTE